jgi:hypothetical protein
MKSVLEQEVQLEDAFLDRMRETIDPPADAVAATLVEQGVAALVKDLIRQQEENRFKQFVAEEVSSKDRDLIYEWLGAFVTQHEAVIRQRMDPGSLRTLDESPKWSRLYEETVLKKAGS